MVSRAQVPEGWRRVRLGDVATVNRGTSWSREQESPVLIGNAIPVLRIGNVQQDGFHMDDVLYIQGVSASEKSRRAITPRTLVMVGSNGNRDRVGNTFLANDQVKGHLLASFLIGISPVFGTSERFLVASLRSSQTQSLITESTSGSTGIKNLSLTWLRNLPILLPPLAEQRAIAAVLDAIDEAIERTEAVVAATERVRDALLHELLTRGVPGWHTAWKEAPGIGTIPASWEVVRLEDVATLRGGYGADAHADPLPYIGLEHIASGGQLLGYGSAGDFISTKTRFLKGDTLYGKLRPNLRKVLRAPFGGTCTTELLALYGKLRLDSGFLGYVLRRESFHRYAMTGITGTKMPRTSWDHLRHYRLALPPSGEQRAIAALLSSVEEAIERGRAETDVLRSLKASAADALLTGRVRVEP